MNALPDPGLSFENLVVGSPNRVAAAAARRAAEAPGGSYNPLLICGPAGVGKTHLLCAIAAQARAVDPEIRLHYESVASFVDRLTSRISAGALKEFRESFGGLDLLLLDDLQQAAGMARTQEELSLTLDELVRRGAQVVVTADRLPHEIPALDEKLAGRLASGLLVDAGPLDAAMRLELVERVLEERGASLDTPTVRALAALPIGTMRELRAAVKRVLTLGEEAGRPLLPAEVPEALGYGKAEEAIATDEFGSFLSDVSTAVAAVVETAPWRRRIATAILRWEGEGFRTRRLEAALDADSAPDVDALLDGFARDVARLRQIRSSLTTRPADPTLFSDPDRLGEAEALLEPSAAPRKARVTSENPLIRRVRTRGGVDGWYRDREKIAWSWVALEDRIMEEQG